jgi:hypothetical protein
MNDTPTYAMLADMRDRALFAERELTAVTEQRDEWKAKYIQQNKDLGCEMMDPDGTIWDYAKKVQLELTAMTEQRDRLQKIVDEQCRFSSVCREYREQRDRLAEALRKLADCDWVITLPDRMDAVRTIANEALQSLTQTQPEP